MGALPYRGIFRGLPALVMALAGMAILGFGVFSWYSYTALRAEQLAEAEAQALRTRLAFASHVNRTIDYGDSYLRSVRQVYLRTSSAEALRRHMAEVAAPNAEAFTGSILAVDETGRLVFHSHDVLQSDVNGADLEFFRAFRDDPTDRLIIDPTRVGRATGQLQFRLVRPVLRDGRFAGVLVLTMKPEHITDFYRDFNIGTHTASMLLTTDLRVIARDPAAKEIDFAGPIPGLQVWRGHDLDVEPTGSLRQKSVIDGMMRTFYYAKLPYYPLVVSVGVADDDIAARIAGTARNLAWLAAAFAFTTLLIASLLVGVILANRKLAQAHQASRHATEQVQKVNTRLQRANALLERSNADLEQFAYVASHDLQTPLRNMTSFAQLLNQRYGGQLDQDGRDFLGFIVSGAQQMSQLIVDLLDYSRISSQGQPLAAVSAAAAVETALQAIGPRIAQDGATVTVDPLPDIMADAGQLARLFQNLIENALKYRRPDGPVEIHISARPDEHDLWKISVADNGIGIDPAYFDKIFVIFQRLHPVGQYAGTGIGLAVCKRIVTRMGGEIGVISQPGQGATFFFTAHSAEIS